MKKVNGFLCAAFATVFLCGGYLRFSNASTLDKSGEKNTQQKPGALPGVSFNSSGALTVADDNLSRPDFLHGTLCLPATTHYPQKEYQAGSGGKTSDCPSIPYGTYTINGMYESKYIEGLSGDAVVFSIENMFDEKVGRERTAMLLHRATVPTKLVSSGCIVIGAKEYNLFKKHMTEALNQYGDLTVRVAPACGSSNATFAIRQGTSPEGAPNAVRTKKTGLNQGI